MFNKWFIVFFLTIFKILFLCWTSGILTMICHGEGLFWSLLFNILFIYMSNSFPLFEMLSTTISVNMFLWHFWCSLISLIAVNIRLVFFESFSSSWILLHIFLLCLNISHLLVIENSPVLWFWYHILILVNSAAYTFNRRFNLLNFYLEPFSGL